MHSKCTELWQVQHSSACSSTCLQQLLQQLLQQFLQQFLHRILQQLLPWLLQQLPVTPPPAMWGWELWQPLAAPGAPGADSWWVLVLPWALGSHIPTPCPHQPNAPTPSHKSDHETKAMNSLLKNQFSFVPWSLEAATDFLLSEQLALSTCFLFFKPKILPLFFFFSLNPHLILHLCALGNKRKVLLLALFMNGIISGHRY